MKKYYLAIGWLLTITFDVVSVKKRILGALIEQKRFSFDNLTNVVF